MATPKQNLESNSLNYKRFNESMEADPFTACGALFVAACKAYGSEGNLPSGLKKRIVDFEARGVVEAAIVANWRLSAYECGINTVGRPGLAPTKQVIDIVSTRDRIGKDGINPEPQGKRKADDMGSAAEMGDDQPAGIDPKCGALRPGAGGGRGITISRSVIIPWHIRYELASW